MVDIWECLECGHHEIATDINAQNAHKDTHFKTVNQLVEEATKAFTGARLNTGKIKLSLVPTEAIEGIARAFMYGMTKYKRDNWRGGMPYTEVFESAERHMRAWLERAHEGDRDLESGELHLDHAICNLAMLIWFCQHQIGVDDRFAGKAPAMTQAEVEANLKEIEDDQGHNRT